MLHTAAARWRLGASSGARHDDPTVAVDWPLVEVYCASCERRQTFDPYFSAIETAPAIVSLDAATDRPLALPFRCRTCARAIVVFAVTRAGIKLTLARRTVIATTAFHRTRPAGAR